MIRVYMQDGTITEVPGAAYADWEYQYIEHKTPIESSKALVVKDKPGYAGKEVASFAAKDVKGFAYDDSDKDGEEA